ncbi:hypothetical protein ST37_13210 [Vibrio sp. qd031]|uniref:chemotaxis protein CheW n=1 Tax=Vibrio sp. qd031 TaxID=1603038 RepID=UPI000A114A98|nr:chemotaxis protein CheW [Vibrio sp. qd031]ORT49368.1 hypothetical protein ST37_13210 [Vibrio sp. qd031]
MTSSNSTPEYASADEVLNDYFDALLIEEPEAAIQASSAMGEVGIEPNTPTHDDFVVSTSTATVIRPEPEPEPQSYYPVVEVPLLEDVQKLFDQLNQKNVADEPEIESIIERNTDNIARAETATAKQVETAITETPQAEIIQPVIPVVDIKPSAKVVTDPTQDTQLLADTESKPAFSHVEPQWQSGEREGEFQVLYFEVADVLFAVPLEELGGIHRLETLSHLIGRPNWYLGLQSTRELKIDVVDTALWAMEDRLSGTEHQSNYEYIIMLDQSKWGLASNALKGTESLPTTSVNWRSQPGKRPWLAGMVKKKMCALIHVSAMIEMLDSGVSMSMLKNQKVVGNV